MSAAGSLHKPPPAARLDRQIERLCALTRRGARLGLERMQEALALSNEPQQRYPAIHVAGTNGKGSTSAMIEAIARRSGLWTGLYTSPHLCRFNERIRLGGEPIDDAAFAHAIERAMHRELPPLSLFETLTLAAFVAFARARVDVAIVEVGLGGRLDATNVLDAPACAAITSIGIDHQRFLGSDLAAIAREKAAIAKAGAPLVVAPLAEPAALATAEVATRVGADPIWWIDDGSPDLDRTLAQVPGDRVVLERGPTNARVVLPDGHCVDVAPALAGDHQRVNAAVAAATTRLAARVVPGLDERIAEGISAARWPGRLELIPRGSLSAEPPYPAADVQLDCAHNLEGVGALCAYLDKLAPADPVLIFGALDEKPHGPMLDALAPRFRRRHYCPPLDAIAGRRPVEPRELHERWPGELHARPDEALAAAMNDAAGRNDLVVVTGSIFLVGSVRGTLYGLPRHASVPL